MLNDSSIGRYRSGKSNPSITKIITGGHPSDLSRILLKAVTLYMCGVIKAKCHYFTLQSLSSRHADC